MDEISKVSIEKRHGKKSLARAVFYGKNGIRVIWCVLLFTANYLTLDWCSNAVLNRISWLSVITPVPPLVALVRESIALLAVIGTTWLMALVENRNMASFGYRTKDWLKRFTTGAAIGFLSLSAMVAMMWNFGFINITGFSLHGSAILLYGGIWALVFIMIGLLEESIFRGYLQSTLARGIGYWPAALLVSGGFILWHVSNKSESALGLITIGAGSLVFSLSLYYTKSLWWAIGFHTGWDWSQNFFYGTPDSGIVTKGHLLNTYAAGDPLWSGGIVGPEGSAFFLPLLILVIMGMWFWWSLKRSKIG